MIKQKVKAILFVIFLIVAIVLSLMSIIFRSIFIFIMFVLSAIFAIFFGYLLTRNTQSPLNTLLKYHKLKENLLQQKMQLQKQYLKRQISQKQFNNLAGSLDKKILLLDYRIKYIDTPLLGEPDLKRTIKFLQRKYFKQEITENLYNRMMSDLSRALAKLKTDEKKKNRNKK